MKAKKQYNYCLDFIKGIACIFVVFMHCEFPGVLGTAVQAVSRFCVPFFFMVSGYFCFLPSIASNMLGVVIYWISIRSWSISERLHSMPQFSICYSQFFRKWCLAPMELLLIFGTSVSGCCLINHSLELLASIGFSLLCCMRISSTIFWNASN